MRRYVITVTIIILAILGVFATIYLVQEAQVADRYDAEYEIIDITVGFTKRTTVERSVFTIALGEGDFYTLPSLPTSYVRNYYIGDMLPVTVTEYKDGTRELEVNRSKSMQLASE